MEDSFKQWFEMTWKVMDTTLKQYKLLKSIVDKDPSVMGRDVPSELGGGHGILNWQKAAQYHMQRRGEEIDPKEFVLKHQKCILAKVDPCILIDMRNPYSTISGEEYYEKLLKKVRAHDLGLVIVFVPPNPDAKPFIYDGNHRIMAACKQRQDAYAAFVYWFDINDYPIKAAIKEIISN